MFAAIKRKLSLKVSFFLALFTVPMTLIAAFLLTARQGEQMEKQTVDNAKVAAMTGANMYGAILEAGIDAGLFTTGDVLQPVYEEIKGYDFGGNPRFHTRYDFYTDRTAVDFQNRIVESFPDLIYAVGTDVNGYLPTHNIAYAAPMTGDRAKDLSGNRNKRKFTTPMHKAAAANLDPLLVQPYTSDAGERSWDVSSPIYVKGRHYGAFRVGVARASVDAHKRSLMISLSIIFGLIAALTTGAIFFMLQRAMRPLEALSAQADQLSSGEQLDQPIKPTTIDEVGQMAASLNRLRASLHAAMTRLGV
jgi:HAMP domain-containing protein